MHTSWEQLQTLEALVRSGSVQAAARELGLRHSSVSRRIAGLEEALGSALFSRGARLVPTELARELFAVATRMREQAAEAEALVRAHERRAAGRCVITTSDVLAPLLFRALGAAKLAIEVEVSVTDQERPLAPGVVDFALRPTHDPAGELRGQRVGMLRMAVVRSKALSPGSRAWVMPAEVLRQKASMRWWRAIPVVARTAIECDSLAAMHDACLAGLGHAILPAFLAQGDARLEVVEELGQGTPLWLLSPATVARSSNLSTVRRSLLASLRSVPSAWR